MRQNTLHKCYTYSVVKYVYTQVFRYYLNTVTGVLKRYSNAS